MKSNDKDFKIFENKGNQVLAIRENYNYSPTSIISHLLKNKCIQILAKKSWFLTDDFQSEFIYKGHVFELSTTRDSIDIMPLNSNTSNNTCNELY